MEAYRASQMAALFDLVTQRIRTVNDCMGFVFAYPPANHLGCNTCLRRNGRRYCKNGGCQVWLGIKDQGACYGCEQQVSRRDALVLLFFSTSLPAPSCRLLYAQRRRRRRRRRSRRGRLSRRARRNYPARLPPMGPGYPASRTAPDSGQAIKLRGAAWVTCRYSAPPPCRARPRATSRQEGRRI